MDQPHIEQASSEIPTADKPQRWFVWLKGILAVLVIIAAVFTIIVNLLPSNFQVVRTARMSASVPEVFAQVNDFHKWQAWSPWAKLDPAATATFEGPASGPGAVFKWAGNSEVGKGSMMITQSEPHEFIGIRIDFVEPFEDTSHASFVFRPEGDHTQVTWSLEGDHTFVSKAVCLFLDMDQMVGGQFEQGLANMKAIVEADFASEVGNAPPAINSED